MSRTLRRRQHESPPGPLPSDEAAERAVIGCVLYGRDHDDLDPTLIVHDGRRALLCAALTLRQQGGHDWPAAASTHVGDELRAACSRGERVGRAVIQCRTWPNADPPDWELRHCIDAATQPDLIGYHIGLLLEAWKRRKAVVIADRLRDAAHDPSADIAAIVQGLDVGSLAKGERPRKTSAALTRLADVMPVPIRWLWAGRIARGKLTLLAGQPGLGKSLLTIDLAARVSRGWDWPDGERAEAPADVILLSAEDDPADTIRPRLDAAGADVSRISLLQAVRRRDPDTGEARERSLSLAHDLPAIADALHSLPRCTLIVIDPITAYLSGIDTHRNSDVRGLLAPLSKLAQGRGVAIVAVSHLNKAADSARPALDRINGSGAFCAAARAVWIVGRESETSPRRIVASAKNNLGPDATGLAYTIAVSPDGVPVLTWESEPVTTSADELLARIERDAGSGGSALVEAVEWLRDRLAGGPVTARELQRRAREDGLAWGGAVRRAKEALGIHPRKDGMDGVWSWALPADEGAQTPAEQDAQTPTP